MGFIDYVVSPLWIAVGDIFPKVSLVYCVVACVVCVLCVVCAVCVVACAVCVVYCSVVHLHQIVFVIIFFKT